MYKYHPESEHKYARILVDLPSTVANQSVATFLYAPSDKEGEAMAMGLDVVTHLQRFRDLRLHHYQMALKCTHGIDKARRQRDALSDGRAMNAHKVKELTKRLDMLKSAHHHHMTAVQTLNVLFPVGDNVEGDMPK